MNHKKTATETSHTIATRHTSFRKCQCFIPFISDLSLFRINRVGGANSMLDAIHCITFATTWIDSLLNIACQLPNKDHNFQLWISPYHRVGCFRTYVIQMQWQQKYFLLNTWKMCVYDWTDCVGETRRQTQWTERQMIGIVFLHFLWTLVSHAMERDVCRSLLVWPVRVSDQRAYAKRSRWRRSIHLAASQIKWNFFSCNSWPLELLRCCCL